MIFVYLEHEVRSGRTLEPKERGYKVSDIDEDDFVTLKDGVTGNVKFIGEDGAGKPLIGLDLECYDAAMGTGELDGKKYYDVKEGHGRFIRPDQISRLRKRPPNGELFPWEKPFECLGVKCKLYDKVVLKKNKRIGVIRAWFKNKAGLFSF